MMEINPKYKVFQKVYIVTDDYKIIEAIITKIIVTIGVVREVDYFNRNRDTPYTQIEYVLNVGFEKYDTLYECKVFETKSEAKQRLIDRINEM